MPTYEYACTQCGQHVEVFQRLSEAPLETCGACGGPLRKVFHPAGIVFKGSGFYATDSRSAAPSKGSDAKKKDDASSSSSAPSASSASGSSSSDGAAGTAAPASGEKAS
jgi:putative FmdB family regulatory protein